MNEHDFERIVGFFEVDGFVLVVFEAEVDVVVFNICCIWENVDNKLYGTFGYLKQWKVLGDDCQIVVVGCLAQKDRDLVWVKVFYVDVVFGMYNVHWVAELVVQVWEYGLIMEIFEEVVFDDYMVFLSVLLVWWEMLYNAWVIIQIGCDNVCVFCIVFVVRGVEVS